MRLRSILLLVLLVPVLHAPGAGASLDASEPVGVHALAVSVAEDGSHRGVTAEVEAQAVRGGSGRVYIDTKPLAETDMQGSARLAARVAADALGLDWRAYDYLVVFRSPSPVVGGPSAGAVMGLALASALWNLEHPGDPWTPDPRLAATGTINPDGTIGPVGGVPAKARGAADAGLRAVVYPAGQETALATTAGGEQVAVDMDAHCDELGIDCHPAATLAQLIEASVGVRVQRQEQPVPSTRDFADELGPSVSGLVDDLASGIDAAQEALDAAGGDDAVQQRIDTARDRLADARAQQDDESYYLAATSSFRGSIEATAALWQARVLSGADPADALAACDDAIAAESDLPGEADDWNRLFGLAAARTRILQAAELRAQSEAALAQGAVGDGVFTSAFCIERAATVGWWAGLPDAFGPGPRVDDLDEQVTAALDGARESVAYALAVLGTSGGGQERLAVAQQAAEDDEPALALLAAVEAQVQSAVALQTGTGLGVPPAVLEAAEQGAARAVARAREAGAEPVLPVSLVELSTGQENGEALESLWLARSLALLVVTDLPPPAVSVSGEPYRFVPASWMLGAGVVGVVAGAAVVGGVWFIVAAVRRAGPEPEPPAPPQRPSTPTDSGPRFQVAPPERIDYQYEAPEPPGRDL